MKIYDFLYRYNEASHWLKHTSWPNDCSWIKSLKNGSLLFNVWEMQRSIHGRFCIVKFESEHGARERPRSPTQHHTLAFWVVYNPIFFLSLRSRRTQDMIENLLPDYEYCTHFNVCYHSSQNSITADVTLDVAINRMECNLLFVSVCYQNYETILYLHWLPFSSRTWQLQLQLKLIVPLVRKTNMTRSTMTNHKPK